jgi:hypothetical protein
VLLPFAIKHPEPTAQGKQRHPKLKFQHSSGHSQLFVVEVTWALNLK